MPEQTEGSMGLRATRMAFASFPGGNPCRGQPASHCGRGPGVRARCTAGSGEPGAPAHRCSPGLGFHRALSCLAHSGPAQGPLSFGAVVPKFRGAF